MSVILFTNEEIETILQIIEESNGKDAILLSRLRENLPDTALKVEELLRQLRPITPE